VTYRPSGNPNWTADGHESAIELKSKSQDLLVQEVFFIDTKAHDNLAFVKRIPEKVVAVKQ